MSSVHSSTRGWLHVLRLRAKGRLDVLKFLLKYHVWYCISAAAIGLSLLGFFSAGGIAGLAGGIGAAVGALALLLGVICFVSSTQQMYKNQADMFALDCHTPLDHLKGIEVSGDYLRSGYTKEEFDGRCAIYSREVNSLLEHAQLGLTLQEGNFRIGAFAMKIAPFAVLTAFETRAILFNQPKVRLSSDLLLDDRMNWIEGSVVRLQKTDYFSGLCTNEMTCRQVWSRRKLPVGNSPEFNGFSFMVNSGKIKNLSDSYGDSCANYIGVSTLAFTRDGYLILTVQSAQSAQSANLLAPSGSGSAEVADINSGSPSGDVTLQSFVVKAMERELREECGLKGIDRSNFIGTRLIGFARDINRGGKPEFFGVSFIDECYDVLQVIGEEVAFISDIMNIQVDLKDADGLKTELQNIREQNDRNRSLSFPLYLNLLFLEQYLNSSPNSFRALVKNQ